MGPMEDINSFQVHDFLKCELIKVETPPFPVINNPIGSWIDIKVETPTFPVINNPIKSWIDMSLHYYNNNSVLTCLELLL